MGEEKIPVKSNCTSVRVSGDTWFGVIQGNTELTDTDIIEKE